MRNSEWGIGNAENREMHQEWGLRYSAKITGCQPLSGYGVTTVHQVILKIKGIKIR